MSIVPNMTHPRVRKGCVGHAAGSCHERGRTLCLTTWPREMFRHQGFSSIWSGCMKGLRLSISLNRFWLPAPLKGLAALLAFALGGAPKGLLPEVFPKGEAGFAAWSA